jgi:putative transposase
MAHAKGQVVITAAQRAVLERLVRAYTTPQHIAQRARIVLLSGEGTRNVDQAAALGTDPQRIRRWRRRWADAQATLAAAEVTEGEDAYVEDLIIDLLQDERRSGRKPLFTAEQVAQIIAVACEKPEASDRPVSHWTPRELADEVMKRGIVTSISPRHIARFFGGGRAEAASNAVLAQREDQGPRSGSVRPRFHGGVRRVPARR